MKSDEMKTWLNQGTVVSKGEKRIAFRGEIDSLYAECVCACADVRGKNGLAFSGFAEISKTVGKLMRCEALCENMEFYGVLGYSVDDLRQFSQNPKKYFGASIIFGRTKMRACPWRRQTACGHPSAGANARRSSPIRRGRHGSYPSLPA